MIYTRRPYPNGPVHRYERTRDTEVFEGSNDTYVVGLASRFSVGPHDRNRYPILAVGTGADPDEAICAAVEALCLRFPDRQEPVVEGDPESEPGYVFQRWDDSSVSIDIDADLGFVWLRG